MSHRTLPAGENMTITCQKCSAQNRAGAKFCNDCGHSLSSASAVPAIAAGPTGEFPSAVPSWLNQDARANPNRYLIWYSIAAVCLLAAGGVYWFDATPSQSGASLATAVPDPEPAALPTPEPAPAMAPIAAATPEPVPDPVVNKPPAGEAQKPLVHKPPRQSATSRPAPVLVPTQAPVPVSPEAPVTPLVSEARTVPPPVQPAPPPVAAAGPTSPQEACGKRVFLALAMCMQEQCQTPQFITHPQCVQMFQQQKESRQRNAERF